MATTAKVGPQDMPPQGGYKPYQIDRIPLRTIIGGRSGMALLFGVTIGGCFLYYLDYKRVRIEKIERRSARLVLQTLMDAEGDRVLLKHMRRMRDEEIKLMKDVPGWEVGKFFTEPLYHTIPENEFIYLKPRMLQAFMDPKEYCGYSPGMKFGTQ